MADVLIRNVPAEVLVALDAQAARLGLSRVEYIRRRLTADAVVGGSVSVDDLRSFSDRFPDLADEQVIDAAWR